MDGWDILVAVVSALALGISLTVLSLDITRYLRRLQINTVAVSVYNTGNQSLVLFHLIFVNPSSRGRTVLSYTIKSPVGITDTAVYPVRDEELQTAFYRLPNGEKTPKYKLDELLLGSLDILPYQSQNKIVGYYLQADFERRNRFPLPETFYIFVQDIHGKQLAHTFLQITDEQLTTDGVYPLSKLVRSKT